MDRTNKQFKFSDRFYMPDPPKYKETIAVDTKTLLSAKKREDESPFFHDELKGCSIEKFKNNSYCDTHKCNIHNDGWQVGFWNGTSSKFLKEYAPRVSEEVKPIKQIPIKELYPKKTPNFTEQPKEIKPILKPWLKTTEKVCEMCGNSFIAFKSNSRYCKSCRRQRNLEYYKNKYKERTTPPLPIEPFNWKEYFTPFKNPKNSQ